LINIDTQVNTAFGRRIRFNGLRFGIELEVERYRDAYDELGFWTLERDTSLRDDGAEYVSHPLQPDAVPHALLEAKQSMTEHNVRATWRCGVHVHINVQYWTWGQLLQFAVLSTLVEPYLFEKFAEGRETSHFCVPTWANTRLVDAITADATSLRAGIRDYARLTLLNCSKYASINYKPIQGMGTVELRHLPGTTDTNKVQKFVEFLEVLVNMAHAYDTPEAIITEYEDLGPLALLERLDLHTCEPDALDIEDALIAATLMCGHDPMKWQDLRWEMPEAQVVRINGLQIDDLDEFYDILEGDE